MSNFEVQNYLPSSPYWTSHFLFWVAKCRTWRCGFVFHYAVN